MTLSTLALALVALVTALNAVAVVALIRQVGILHLRIRPVAGLTGAGGPSLGTKLNLPTEIADATGRGATHYLLGFVSPTCGLCKAVVPALGAVAKAHAPQTAVLLVLDATPERAAEYLRSSGAGHLPHLAYAGSFAASAIPGAPWIVITDRSGVVLNSGAVNTLDNIEEMLSQVASGNGETPTLRDTHSSLEVTYQ